MVFCSGSLCSITFTLLNSKHLETSGAADGVGTCTEVFEASQFIRRTHLRPSFDFLTEVLRLFTSSLPSSSWCHEVLPVLHEWMAAVSLEVPSFSSIIILLPVTRVTGLLWFGGFGAVASSSLSRFSGYVKTFVPCSSIRFRVLCCSHGIDLQFSHWCVSSWAVWRRRFFKYVLNTLLVQMNEEPSCMDQTGGRPHRCFTLFGLFPLILWWCETKKHWVWE